MARIKMLSCRVFLFVLSIYLVLIIFNEKFRTKFNNEEKNKILVQIPNSRVYIYSAIAVFRQDSYEAAETSKILNKFNAIAISAFEIKFERPAHFLCCYMLRNGTLASYNSSVMAPFPGSAIRQAILFICPLNQDSSKIQSVSLSFNNNSCSNDEMYYKSITIPKKYKRANITEKTIAVCAKLSYVELDASRLVEWLEALKLLGVDKVLTHTFQLNPGAREVYNYYEYLGFVETVAFDLPEKDLQPLIDTETLQGWNDEQVALYDCQTRLIMYDYVVVLDTDEYLIPNFDGLENGLRKLFDTIFQNRLLATAKFWTTLHITTWGPSDPEHELFIGRYNNCTVPMIDREKLVFMPTKIHIGRITTHKNKPMKGLKKYPNTMVVELEINAGEVGPRRGLLHHYRTCRKEWMETRSSFHHSREEWLERRVATFMNFKNDTYFFKMKEETYCYDFHRFSSDIMRQLSNAIKNNVSRILTSIQENRIIF